MDALPGLTAYSEGRDILLTFNEHIGDALNKACKHDSEASHLAKAAQYIRNDMFSKSYSFDGEFDKNQEDVVLSSLLALVRMLLSGANIKKQRDMSANDTRIANTVCQFIMFNSVKHSTTSSSGKGRHNRERETPLVIYLALKCHALTRSRSLVDTMFNLGICISYDRLLQLGADMANGVLARFEIENVVCPPKLRTNVFTTCAVDNIDHNPSSSTSHGSFHGTAISAIQHPTHDSPGADRGVVVFEEGSPLRKVRPLPSCYDEVRPVASTGKQNIVPYTDGFIHPTSLDTVVQGRDKEVAWLQKAVTALERSQPEKDEFISWSAYHANLQEETIPPPAITAMLPMFHEAAHTLAMIKHAMTLVQSLTEHVNPGQIPVITADQPLYALAKEVQWNWPALHGEDHMIVMFGGLHIEMAILKVFDYLPIIYTNGEL